MRRECVLEALLRKGFRVRADARSVESRTLEPLDGIDECGDALLFREHARYAVDHGLRGAPAPYATTRRPQAIISTGAIPKSSYAGKIIARAPRMSSSNFPSET